MNTSEPVRGFIFDLDDTLVATADLWRDAEAHLLSRLGARWSVELASQYKGMNTLDVAATIWRVLRPGMAVEECQRVLRDRLMATCLGGTPREIPGAVDLVRRCAATPGATLAVASGSPLPVIDHALRALGVDDCIAARVTSESVPRGKPHPDVFLAAAERLSLRPEACLVFEDSLHGAEAARAAGMRCIVRAPAMEPALTAAAWRAVTCWRHVTPADWA